MKKAVILIVQMIFVITLVSACGSGQNNLQQNVNQNAVQNESQTEDEGNLTAKDGSYTDSNNSDNNGTLDGSQNDTYEEPNGQTDSLAFTFPDNLLGTYGPEYNTAQYITIEANQITINNEGEINSVDSSIFAEAGIENVYSAYQEETGVYITLTFLESMNEGEQDIYVEYSGADSYYSFSGAKLTTIDGIPLDNYVSLDSAGEFGTMPMTEDLKNIILSKVTEDYFIVYNPAYEFYSDGKSFTCEMYDIASFDELGYKLYTGSCELYVCSSDADAAIIAEYYSGYSDQQGSITIVNGSTETPKHFYENSKQAYLRYYSSSIVYGEHCFLYEDLNEICYMSKPFSIEQGKAWKEATELISKMYCYYSYNDDQSAFIDLGGTGFDPYIQVYDETTAFDASYTNFVKASGDMLIAYGYIEGYEGYESVTYVTEFTTDGVNVTAHSMKYSGIDEINYDNYTEYTPEAEVTVTALHTVE